MNEELFMKIFANETNLRVLKALRERGESSLYGLLKFSGMHPNGNMRKRLHQILDSLTALDMVLTRTASRVRKGTKLRLAPEWSRTHVEYRLNRAHPLMPTIEGLLEAVRVEEARLSNGGPHPW